MYDEYSFVYVMRHVCHACILMIFACFGNMHGLCLVRVHVLDGLHDSFCVSVYFNTCRHGVVFPHWYVRLV